MFSRCVSVLGCVHLIFADPNNVSNVDKNCRNPTKIGRAEKKVRLQRSSEQRPLPVIVRLHDTERRKNGQSAYFYRVGFVEGFVPSQGTVVNNVSGWVTGVVARNWHGSSRPIIFTRDKFNVNVKGHGVVQKTEDDLDIYNKKDYLKLGWEDHPISVVFSKWENENLITVLGKVVGHSKPCLGFSTRYIVRVDGKEYLRTVDEVEVAERMNFGFNFDDHEGEIFLDHGKTVRAPRRDRSHYDPHVDNCVGRKYSTLE